MVLRASAPSRPRTEARPEADDGGALIAAARSTLALGRAAIGACLGLLTGPLLGIWQALTNAPPEPLPDSWRAVLAPHLPAALLDAVRFCAPARLPVPRPYIGFTLGRTIFLRDALGAPDGPQLGLVMHELAHVAQFRRYGFLNMCMHYGAGLCRHGYAAHPLEHEARTAEAALRSLLHAAPVAA